MQLVQVAACICLFALDKREAIPVDTHVWQLAVRYYTPHLKGTLPMPVTAMPESKVWKEIYSNKCP